MEYVILDKPITGIELEYDALLNSDGSVKKAVFQQLMSTINQNYLWKYSRLDRINYGEPKQTNHKIKVRFRWKM